jgi:hypothetical protein
LTGPLPPGHAGFAFLIVADFPALFTELSEMRFTLLWRDSRNGFGTREIHRHCNCNAPTLALI